MPAPRSGPRSRRLRAAAVVVLTGVLAAASGCGDGPGPNATVVAEIPTDPPPGSAIVLHGDSVWVVASTTFVDRSIEPRRHAVVRIDRETREVRAVVAVPHQVSAVAAGEGAVWATGSDFGGDDEVPYGSLLRIDPSIDAVTATVELPDAAPTDVVIGHGRVWVADSRGDRVLAVDPSTETVVGEVPIEGLPSSLAVTDDAVWVNKPRTGQVRPLDPSTLAPLPAVATGPLPSILQPGRDGVWVADYAENDLSLVDPVEGEVTRSVDFGTPPSRFAVTDTLIAVVSTEEERLFLLDPESGGPRTVLEGRRLVALVIDDGSVWAVDAGTRTVLLVELPD